MSHSSADEAGRRRFKSGIGPRPLVARVRFGSSQLVPYVVEGSFTYEYAFSRGMRSGQAVPPSAGAMKERLRRPRKNS